MGHIRPRELANLGVDFELVGTPTMPCSDEVLCGGWAFGDPWGSNQDVGYVLHQNLWSGKGTFFVGIVCVCCLQRPSAQYSPMHNRARCSFRFTLQSPTMHMLCCARGFRQPCAVATHASQELMETTVVFLPTGLGHRPAYRGSTSFVARHMQTHSRNPRPS